MLIHPIIDKLKNLRLNAMAHTLEEQMQMPDIESLSFEERFEMMRHWYDVLLEQEGDAAAEELFDLQQQLRLPKQALRQRKILLIKQKF